MLVVIYSSSGVRFLDISMRRMRACWTGCPVKDYTQALWHGFSKTRPDMIVSLFLGLTIKYVE
jgi:hypothetical protein